MRPQQYRKVYDWFTARPAALRALRLTGRALPVLFAGAYLALLGLLAAGTAAGVYPMRLAVRAVLVPGAVFGGGSALRAALDRPRPYQQPGCPRRRRAKASPPGTC